MYDYNNIPQYHHLCRSLITQKDSLLNRVNSPLLTQTRENVITEVDLLESLLMTQYLISELNIYDSLFYLYKCKSELDSWDYKFVNFNDVCVMILYDILH
jgi:hypothetical protein